MMVKTTFGDPNRYKTLEYITEQISLMDKSNKEYLSSFLINFNIVCNELNKLNCGDRFLRHLIKLNREHYKAKLNILEKKYDERLMSYMRNFIYTKLLLINEKR